MSDDIDGDGWELQAPSGRPKGGPRIGISASALGRVLVSINTQAAAELGLAAGVRVDLLVGTGERIGQLLIRRNANGAFGLRQLGRGGLVIGGWRPEWAPDMAIARVDCAWRRAGLAGAVVELPDWYDRDLQREIERREGAPADPEKKGGGWPGPAGGRGAMRFLGYPRADGQGSRGLRHKVGAA